MKAYILVKIESAATGEALGLIRKGKGVVSADVTFGPYDMVVQVESESLEVMARTVIWEIRTVPGVLDTLTCVAVSM
jgi:hypothetical protein